ncbi:hypothetical protein LINPERHAP1_LOCUS31607 [Linum perenne]
MRCEDVKISWIYNAFHELPQPVGPNQCRDPLVVTFMHGSTSGCSWILFLRNQSRDHILADLLPLVGDPNVAATYSWGSVVLSWLYQQMGRAVIYVAGSQMGTETWTTSLYWCICGRSRYFQVFVQATHIWVSFRVMTLPHGFTPYTNRDDVFAVKEDPLW